MLRTTGDSMKSKDKFDKNLNAARGLNIPDIGPPASAENWQIHENVTVRLQLHYPRAHSY